MKEEQKTQDDNYFFDLIIQEIGGFGRFQKLILFLSSISSVTAACNHLSPIYLTYTPCFECSNNDNLTNFQCNATGNQVSFSILHTLNWVKKKGCPIFPREMTTHSV